MRCKATEVEVLDRIVHNEDKWVVIKILPDGDWKQLFVLMNDKLEYIEVVIYNAESVEWVPE